MTRQLSRRLHRLIALGASLLLAAAASAQNTDQPVESTLKKLSLAELMDVEVTSVSRQPERLLEAPAAIQVVTNDDIRRSGATSIPEALKLADNLDVAQKNSHDWGISARGFNTELANKLLVMIDGRTVYTPLFSGVIWDMQDYLLEDLDRIEVVSGPGGSLWGANAVNGVISIISKTAKDTQGWNVEIGGGNVLERLTSVRYGGVIAPKVYYRIYGKSSSHGDEVLPTGPSFHDSWAKNQAGFRIDSERSEQNTFTLQGDVSGGHDDLQTGGHDTTGERNVLGRWIHTFSRESDLNVQVYYDRTHLVQPEPPLVAGGRVLAPAGTFRDDLDTYDLDFQHRIHLGANRVVWGAGYRFTSDAVANAPSLGFFPTNLHRNLFSAFGQDEVSLRENVLLTIGSKIEHNDYTGFELEPDLRLQWNRSPRQTVWAAVSRAIRAPSRVDRDLSEGVPPYFVLLTGGRDFASENVLAYEAGWRSRISSRGELSLSAFYDRYGDVRSTSFSPATVFPLFFQNNLEGETHGIEGTATYQARPWWRLHAGYNLLEEHLHVKPGRSDINNALNETSDPEQRASLRSSMDLTRRVALDATMRWVDIRPGHNGATPGALPGYVELDARIGWQSNDRLELSIVGQNLLHDHHAEYGFPTATRAEIRRSVYGTAVWRFRSASQ